MARPGTKVHMQMEKRKALGNNIGLMVSCIAKGNIWIINLKGIGNFMMLMVR